MSARPSQGSASFAIVLAAVAAVVVGALLLTFLVYPMTNAFTASSLFGGMTTTPGANVLAVVEGLWTFWGAIIMITITAYLWVTTRQ